MFGNNFLFLGQKKPVYKSKNPVFGSKSLEKVWKKFGKVREQGFSEHSEFSKISEIVLFYSFRKLRKNDIKLELRKSQKTCSDSKTDSKVWLKVRNAGPYKRGPAEIVFVFDLKKERKKIVYFKAFFKDKYSSMFLPSPGKKVCGLPWFSLIPRYNLWDKSFYME